MSATEESQAQKSARLRRERREAKIKAGGSARLDRITGLSGRPQSSLKEESSPSPSAARLSPSPPSPPESQSQSQSQPQGGSVSPQSLPHTPNPEGQTPENIKAQEEYLKALLRSQQAGGPTQAQDQQDPTAKLLSAFLGANSAASNNDAASPVPGPGLGAELGPGAAGGLGGLGGPSGGIPELSPNDLTSALGIPPSLASFFSRQTRADPPAEQARNSTWKLVHLIFALVLAGYVMFAFGNAVRTFGDEPPPPSTLSSPFVVFSTGEAVLAAVRVSRKAKDGEGLSVRTWGRVLGDVLRDGRIVIFLLGMWSVWAGSTEKLGVE